METGNHYVAQVKANQKTLFQETKRAASQQTALSVFRETGKGHGRSSEWSVSVFDASANTKVAEWKNLRSFVHVHREQLRKRTLAVQDAFFISDLRLTAQEFHAGIRGHWGIENRLHWVKDVVHGEDDNRIRKGNGPLSATVCSTIAINIHRKNGHSSIAMGQIMFGANVKELFRFLRT